MIKIIDQKKYGLLLWGTKLGAQSFAQSNIETQSKRPLPDLRKLSLSFDQKDAPLFQYDHLDCYHSYTIYKEVLDWRQRPGYYAITVFVDDNFRAPSDKIQELLLELADTYSSKYYDATKNQIYQHAREDISLFEAILNQDKYQLMSAPGDTSTEPSKHKKALLTYQNNKELQEYLSYLHPTEEPDILSLYLHQSGAISLPPETLLEKGLKLPSYPKNLSLKVIVGGLGGNQHDVKFRVRGIEHTPVNSEFSITNLSKRDSLSFELISDQYEWRGSRKEFYKVADYESLGYKVELDLKKKPELVNLSIHFGLFMGNKVNVAENEKFVYITTNNSRQQYPIQNGKIKVYGIEEGTQITIHYPGNDKVEEYRETKRVSKNEAQFGVKLKQKDTKLSLTLVFPSLEKLKGEKIEIKNKDISNTYPVRSGKVTLYDLEKGDRIYVSFKGNDDFEPLDRKEIRITGQNEEQISLNKKKKPKGGVLDAPLYQKILAIVLLVAIIVLVVWFVMMLFAEKDSYKLTNDKKDENNLVDFDKQLKDIEGNEWEYNSTEIKELDTGIKNYCKDKPEQCSKEKYAERLEQAVQRAQLRAHIDSLTTFVDTLGKQDQDSLMNIDTTTNYGIDRFKFAYGKEGEKKYNAFKKLMEEKIDGTRVNPKNADPQKDNRPNATAVHNQAKRLLKDPTFSKKATAQSYIKKLDKNRYKNLISDLDNYIKVCKNFEMYNSLVKCLTDINADQKDKVNDDFECAGVGTILNFRTNNSNLRDYDWLSSSQKDKIRQKWLDLEDKIYKINPNYNPR